MPDARLRVFAYVNAERSEHYRAIMAIFVAAKEGFLLHLRPPDIETGLTVRGLSDTGQLDAVLDQLCEWGNLEKHLDTADVRTVEEFYRPRYLYQLTVRGEAAERSIASYEETLLRPGELQTAALSDIRALTSELAQLASEVEPDAGKIHRTLTALRARFEELTSRAQAFIASLMRSIELHALDQRDFLAYKQTLIDYLERFISQLVIATADIAGAIEAIEQEGVDRVLTVAADRDLIDVLAAEATDRVASFERWQARWRGFRSWFIGAGDAPSQAEVLRARARAAIPALLSAVAALNDKRVQRSDRATDLRALARWFAETDSDHEAHRLWRAAFALSGARHLRIDDATLEERSASPVPPSTSWLEAPPVRIAPRLRATGSYVRRGRSSSVIDRSDEKAYLLQMVSEEASQIERARQRLTTGRRTRLSELGFLDGEEFQLFLDLLGEVLANKVRPSEVLETMSSDGTLRIILEPVGDGRLATIETSEGQFTGPDHTLQIRSVFDDEERQPNRVHGGRPWGG